MRLAEYTDYTLRVLMYCAANAGERVTIADLAERHGVSKNHLMKIVNDLARRGLVETTRGRGGGLRLLADPARLRIGDIVRDCETDLRLVECFDAGGNDCTLSPTCRLKHLFGDALAAFLATLNGATLADIAAPARGKAAARPRRQAAQPVTLTRSRRPERALTAQAGPRAAKALARTRAAGAAADVDAPAASR